MEILMKKHEYAEQVRQINCTSGYFHRFYELTAETQTHQEAWQRLEEERNELGKHTIIYFPAFQYINHDFTELIAW